ncbi:MAG: nucleoside phosphorylase [Planctomycetia bacterium]
MVTGATRADAGIVFALPVEAGRFADRVTDARRIEAAGLTLHEGALGGRAVAWVVGGVGVERAARACRLLVDGHRPRVVISAGFAGALAADLERGRVVAPQVVVRPGSRSIDLATIESIAASRRHTILTVDRVVSTVADKQRLAAEEGADLVDMETWAVAREALDAGVPCQCLRVVSDAATDTLPPEIAHLTEATSPWRRLGAALRTVGSRPAAAADLWRLYERAVVDSRTLADALEREVIGLRLAPPSA